jgi:hypothetical protein
MLKVSLGHNILILAIAISLAGIALNSDAVNFHPSSKRNEPLPILPNPIGTKMYCTPCAICPNNELDITSSVFWYQSLKDKVGHM